MSTQHQSKSITLFLDGTWQKADQPHPTNIALLHNALADQTPDGREQVSYYFNGVGTVGNVFKRAVSGITGYGIGDIVKDAYKTLCTTYEPGDDVNFIGYSRGGTVARTLAGMIHKVGLIDTRQVSSDAELDDLIDQAYELYRDHAFPPKGDDVNPGRDNAEYFRMWHSYTDGAPTNNNTVTINNLVCFDTVGALGIPDVFPGASYINEPYRFYDARIPQSVENAYHLIAADELRDIFSLTAMKAGEDNDRTQVTKLYLPGDHGTIGGGKPEYKGLSDYAAMRAIDLIGEKMTFDPQKVEETFTPDALSSPLTSRQFYDNTNEDWGMWIANMVNGQKIRPSPTCDALHRQCVEVDPAIIERFEKYKISPESLRDYFSNGVHLSDDNTPEISHPAFLPQQGGLTADEPGTFAA